MVWLARLWINELNNGLKKMVSNVGSLRLVPKQTKNKEVGEGRHEIQHNDIKQTINEM
jgi:hypothetical protein